MTAKQLLKILHKDGWFRVDRNSGSHIQLKHAAKKGKVTLSMHPGDLPPKTVNSVLQQAGIE